MFRRRNFPSAPAGYGDSVFTVLGPRELRRSSSVRNVLQLRHRKLSSAGWTPRRGTTFTSFIGLLHSVQFGAMWSIRPFTRGAERTIDLAQQADVECGCLDLEVRTYEYAEGLG
jgi:hypothetical protein